MCFELLVYQLWGNSKYSHTLVGLSSLFYIKEEKHERLLGDLEHWLSSPIEEKPLGIYKKQEMLMVILELHSSLDKGYSLLNSTNWPTFSITTKV